jgi:hypothetical protein
MLFVVIAILVAYGFGYGTREFISYRRRAAAYDRALKHDEAIYKKDLAADQKIMSLIDQPQWRAKRRFT